MGDAATASTSSASRIGGTLYIGVTMISSAVSASKLKITGASTRRYEVGRLVYFEAFDQVEHAIQREAAQHGSCSSPAHVAIAALRDTAIILPVRCWPHSVVALGVGRSLIRSIGRLRRCASRSPAKSSCPGDRATQQGVVAFPKITTLPDPPKEEVGSWRARSTTSTFKRCAWPGEHFVRLPDRRDVRNPVPPKQNPLWKNNWC